MADMDGGPACGLIPMSRLPQEPISNSGTGKRFDSNLNHSVSVESKKKAPKRKTLSSRYGAGIHPKRRKLGLNAIKDPNLSSNEVLHESKSVEGALELSNNHQTLVVDRPVVRKRGRPKKSAPSPGDLEANSKSFPKSNFVRDTGLHATYSEENTKHAFSIETLTPKVNFKAVPRTHTVCNSTGFVSESKTKSDANAGPEVANEKINALSTNGKVKTKSKSLKTYNADSTPSPDQIGNSRTAAGLVRKVELNNLKRESNKFFGNTFHHQQSPKFEEKPYVEIRTAADSEAALSNNSELASFTASEVQGSLASCGTTEEGVFFDTRNLRPRRNPKREPESRLQPADYVGKRVVVYWPHSKAWFAGTVVKYDDCSKKHHIKYDDDDEEFISFRRHKVMLEEPPPLHSGATPHSAEGEAPVENKNEGWHSKMVELEGSVCHLENSPEHDRLKENLSTTLSSSEICNGSVQCVLRECAADHTPNKQMVSDVSHMKSTDRMQLQVMQDLYPLKDVSRPNRTGAVVDPFSPNERDGSKASLVYVRRQKKKQKDEDTFTEDRQKPINSNVVQDENNNSWKSASFTLGLNADQSGMPGTPQSACVNSDVNKSDAGAQEHPLRKRNKLKKLVCIDKYEETMQDPFLSGHTNYAHDGKLRKRARKRRGKKRKLCNSSPKTSNGKILPVMSSVNGHHHISIPTMENDHMQVTDSHQLMSRAVNQNSEPHNHFLLVHRIHAAFHSTISLMLPLITPELFTWQLFNILVHVGFCEKTTFDGKFSMNGSIQDLMGLIRFLMVIIKSLPTSSWINERCSRQWQNSILYQLWVILAGIGPSCRDMPRLLSSKAEKTLIEHLQIISGNSVMTSRQFLNFVVCYFVRPYVTATLCEKGAVFKVAVHQILLLDMRKYGPSSCVKQSVKSFSLRSGAANADKSFSSYLVHLPQCDNGLSRNGLFLKQMEEWFNIALETGYMERLPPVPSVRFLNHLGIQITTAQIASGGLSTDYRGKKAFSLKRCLTDIHKKCSGEALLFSRSLKYPNGCCLIADLHTVFLTASMFLKNHINWLPYPGVCQYIVKSFLKLEMILNKDVNDEGQKHEVSHVHAVGEISSPIVSGNVFTKQVKDDPDANISIRSSSITTESNTAIAIKEESSVEMYGQTIEHGVAGDTKENPFEAGQHSTQIVNDYYVHKRQKDSKKSKRGRPRRSEQERRPRPPTTRYCVADIMFTTGDAVWRESGAKVEVRLTPSNECLVIVHHDGRTYRQKVSGGSKLDSNPDQLVWKSDSDWSLEFLEREQWDAFRRIYNDFVQRTVKVITVKSLPIPSSRLILETDPVLSPCLGLRPPYAIRHADDEIQSALKNNRVLYDLDSEDESWLAETNIKNRAGKENLYITDEVLERIIDKLEKEAYLAKEDTVPIDDAIYACQCIGSDEVVQLVHSYWTMKRQRNGKALLRHFQPPPREQYEKELKMWEAKMEQCPTEQRDSFLKQYPRPHMSAFCLQSRGFDGMDKSKKMLRQRSQKRLKPSRSSSEDSQRPVYWFEDPAWYPSSHFNQLKSPAYAATCGGQQPSLRSHYSDPVSERVEIARSRAAAARKAATAKTVKFQKRFLSFDLALQKAWAFLIDYRAGTVDESSPLTEGFASNMELLFGWCSSLLAQNDNSSDDEPPLSGPNTSDIGQEFLESFTRKCSIENNADNEVHVDQECDGAFIKQDLQEETSPLLPISTKGYPYAWIGSTLLQKPDHPE